MDTKSNLNVSQLDDDKTPIGSIITSLLHYDAFMEVNKFARSSDLKIVKWLPCDGRTVSGTKYAAFSTEGYAPDLRGLFLRGINEYNVPGPGPIKHEHLNPESKAGGEYQKDAIGKHKHDSGVYGPITFAWGSALDGVSLNTYREHNPNTPKIQTSINHGNEEETRPKNITVYYYVKVN